MIREVIGFKMTSLDINKNIDIIVEKTKEEIQFYKDNEWRGLYMPSIEYLVGCTLQEDFNIWVEKLENLQEIVNQVKKCIDTNK